MESQSPAPPREASALVPVSSPLSPVLAGRQISDIADGYAHETEQVAAGADFVIICYARARVRRLGEAGYDRQGHADAVDAIRWTHREQAHLLPDPHNPTWEDAAQLLGITVMMAIGQWKLTDEYPMVPRLHTVLGRDGRRHVLLGWMDRLQLSLEKRKLEAEKDERRRQTVELVGRSKADGEAKRADARQSAAEAEAVRDRPEGQDDAAARRASMAAVLAELRGPT